MRNRILIFFIVLFAFTLLSAKTKVYDMDKILPKKLIVNELPADYPKELDELFQFCYDVLQEVNSVKIENNPSSPNNSAEYDKRWEILNDLFNDLSSKKKKKLRYLNLLANNTIALYYREYRMINDLAPYIKNEDKINLSILPDSTFKNWKQYVDLGSILNAIENYEFKQNPEFALTNNGFWLRLEIISNEMVTVHGETTTYLQLCRAKIVDKFVGEKKTDEIIIAYSSPEFNGNSNYPANNNSIIKLENGKEYLVKGYITFIPNVSYDKVKFENMLLDLTYSNCTGWPDIYEITNETIKCRTFSNTPDFASIDPMNYYKYKDYFLSGNKAEISYQEAKTNVLKVINRYK